MVDADALGVDGESADVDARERGIDEDGAIGDEAVANEGPDRLGVEAEGVISG